MQLSSTVSLTFYLLHPHGTEGREPVRHSTLLHNKSDRIFLIFCWTCPAEKFFCWICPAERIILLDMSSREYILLDMSGRENFF